MLRYAVILFRDFVGALMSAMVNGLWLYDFYAMCMCSTFSCKG